MIDQRKLPASEIYVRCRTAAEVAKAIRTMVIRGAPAIGVAAAFGIALGMRKSTATGTQKFAAEFHKTCELMAATRPTAVNLFYQADEATFAAAAEAGGSVERFRSRREADAVHDEDVASCLRWARARKWCPPMPDPDALQRRRIGDVGGTALGVVRGAVEAGKYGVCRRTRPFSRGRD